MTDRLVTLLAGLVRAVATVVAPVSGGRIVVLSREWTDADDAEFAEACRDGDGAQ